MSYAMLVMSAIGVVMSFMVIPEMVGATAGLTMNDEFLPMTKALQSFLPAIQWVSIISMFITGFCCAMNLGGACPWSWSSLWDTPEGSPRQTPTMVQGQPIYGTVQTIIATPVEEVAVVIPTTMEEWDAAWDASQRRLQVNDPEPSDDRRSPYMSDWNPSQRHLVIDHQPEVVEAPEVSEQVTVETTEFTPLDDTSMSVAETTSTSE